MPIPLNFLQTTSSTNSECNCDVPLSANDLLSRDKSIPFHHISRDIFSHFVTSSQTRKLAALFASDSLPWRALPKLPYPNFAPMRALTSESYSIPIHTLLISPGIYVTW